MEEVIPKSSKGVASTFGSNTQYEVEIVLLGMLGPLVRWLGGMRCVNWPGSSPSLCQLTEWRRVWRDEIWGPHFIFAQGPILSRIVPAYKPGLGSTYRPGLCTKFILDNLATEFLKLYYYRIKANTRSSYLHSFQTHRNVRAVWTLYYSKYFAKCYHCLDKLLHTQTVWDLCVAESHNNFMLHYGYSHMFAYLHHPMY